MRYGYVTGHKKEKKGSQDWYEKYYLENLARIEKHVEELSMYTGSRQTVEVVHRDQYWHGIGTRPTPSVEYATRHCYTCETCGKTYAFPMQAEEPFYCNSQQCQAVTLVSI